MTFAHLEHRELPATPPQATPQPGQGIGHDAAPSAVRPIRVFIAEDHCITLMGLEQLIEAAQPRMSVVGTALSHTSLLAHPALAEADLLLLDLDLGHSDSVETLAELRRRCPGHILILTGADDVQRHRAALAGGARGVLHKSEPAETILRAIEKVHRGDFWLTRDLLGDMLGQLTGHPSPPQRPISPGQQRIASLTPRELEIVRRLSHSAGAKLIAVAADLALSESTLRNHLTTIYSKLGVRGRLELHVFAAENNLTGPTESWRQGS